MSYYSRDLSLTDNSGAFFLQPCAIGLFAHLLHFLLPLFVFVRKFWLWSTPFFNDGDFSFSFVIVEFKEHFSILRLKFFFVMKTS